MWRISTLLLSVCVWGGGGGSRLPCPLVSLEMFSNGIDKIWNTITISLNYTLDAALGLEPSRTTIGDDIYT